MDDGGNGKKHEEYEALFVRFSLPAERFLIRLAVIMLILLAVGQTALQSPALRHWLVRIERLEGVPFPQKNIENQD